MKELLDDARGLARATASGSAGRSSSGRSAARRGRRAPSCSAPTTGGSPARSAAAASRARRPRRSSGPARDGHSRVIRYGISDEEAWDVGLACGGTIDVLVEPAVPDATADAGARDRGVGRRDAAAGGRAAGRVRPSPARRRRAAAGRRSSSRPTGSRRARSGRRGATPRSCDAAREALLRGTSRTVEIGGRSVFVEAFPVRPRLVVVGAVEVARSLVALARELGYETVVVDGRASFATPERFPPTVDRLIVGWPDEVADEIGLGPDDAVAVLTHDVKFDEPAIVEALRRGCRYVGAVGSRRRRAIAASGCGRPA